MEVIEWEKIPESEIKAEIEAALESSGQTRKLKAEIYEQPQFQEWRNQIEQLIQTLGDSTDLTQLTPDDIYDKIVLDARKSMPQELVEKLNEKIILKISLLTFMGFNLAQK